MWLIPVKGITETCPIAASRTPGGIILDSGCVTSVDVPNGNVASDTVLGRT